MRAKSPDDETPRRRFVDLTQRIIYLRCIPVAAELDTRVLTLIARACRERPFQEGAVLMREGEPVEAMHFLMSGELSLTRKKLPLGTLKPPQSLGFLAILGG